MKKRRNEAQSRNHAALERQDHVIAPDGLIPNSVIRAKMKGLSNPQGVSNRLSQEPVNQLSLKTTLTEQKPTQQTPETTSSASTFYWESDPDDERIGPRTKEIVEETLPGSTNPADVVQVIEDSDSSEFKASDVLQIFTEETEMPEALGNEPGGIQITEEESGTSEVLGLEKELNLENKSSNSEVHGVEGELNLEESRTSEVLGVDKELNLDKDENGTHSGFSCGNYSEHLPSTYSCVDEANLLRESHEESTENIAWNEGYLQPDTDLINVQVTIKHLSGNDDRRSDVGSDTPSCVTLENDDEEENNADKLSSATVVLDELRVGEEKRKQASIVSITMETVSRRDGNPAELRSGRAEEPHNLEALLEEDLGGTEGKAANTGNRQKRLRMIQHHSRTITSGRGQLLPNNPAMYRMYKKRDEMLNSVL